MFSLPTKLSQAVTTHTTQKKDTTMQKKIKIWLVANRRNHYFPIGTVVLFEGYRGQLTRGWDILEYVGG